MVGEEVLRLFREDGAAAERDDALVFGEGRVDGGAFQFAEPPSPSSMKISPIGLPAADSTSASVSRSATPRRSASAPPMVLLPEPGGPMMTAFGRMVPFT